MAIAVTIKGYRIKDLYIKGNVVVHQNIDFEPDCGCFQYVLAIGVTKSNGDIDTSSSAVLRSNNYRELVKMAKALNLFLLEQGIQPQELIYKSSMFVSTSLVLVKDWVREYVRDVYKGKTSWAYN